jgi:hypothetical protein
MSGEVGPLRTKQCHNTPESVLEIIRAYAPIGLDPCSNPWSTVGALCSISKHSGGDGLTAKWEQVIDGDWFESPIVFCNPPYADIRPWVAKAIDEAIAGSVETIMLVPADPTPAWARLARTFCSAWGPWAKRIAFVGAGGTGAKQPSALYHFGPNRFRFAHHFEDHLAFVEVMPRGAR